MAHRRAVLTGIPFGKYQLVKRLARGGMAEVFLARQSGPEGFQRMVAVKRILPHLVDSQDFVRMFLDEARLAAQLSHPNVVHIYDFGKVDEHFFIAMEHVDGVHAGVLIKHAETERLPDVLVARIGADACAGLNYAHELREAEGRALHIVHRDVSPPNLLVSYDGSIKLVDFGIAKAVSSIEQTRPGVVKGKFAYMSPEQTIGQKLDGRSDVFSLAVLLWELLAGRVLVPRADPVDGMRMIRDGRLAAIEEERPDIAPALGAAIGRALQTRREDRCTALELGRALEEFIKESRDGIGSALELAEWVRERFPRESLTGNYPALHESPAGTRPATRATHTALPAPDDGMAVRQSVSERMALRPPITLSVEAQHAGSHAALEPASPSVRSGLAELDVEGSGVVGGPLDDVESSSVIVASDWLREERSGRSFDTVAEDHRADTVEAEHDFTLQHFDTDTDITRILAPELLDDDDDDEEDGKAKRRARAASHSGRRHSRIALVIAAGAALGVSSTLVLKRLRTADDTAGQAVTRPARPDPAGAGDAPGATKPGGAATEPSGAASDARKTAATEDTAAAATGDPNAPTATPLEEPTATPLAPTVPGDAAPPPSSPSAAPVPGAGSSSAAVVPAAGDATPSTRAFLEVVTAPRGARVALGDRTPARSPARFADLRPGTYRLRVSLRGHQPVERTIDVVKGERRTIELDLVAERGSRSDERRQADRRAEPPASGVLKVRTRPYSEVYLDGRRLGQTPLVTELRPGSYVLVFKHPGKPSQRRKITVRAGDETKLDFALDGETVAN
jgi:serine/threonine protein kinase